MGRYAVRPTVLYQLPLGESLVISHPEQVVLQFGGFRNRDFGALCFLKRSKNQRKRSETGQRVDIASLSAPRVQQITRLIALVADRSKAGGNTDETLYNSVACVFRLINWCDSNGRSQVLANEESGRDCYKAFVEYLRWRVSTNQLNNNTAATEASITRTWLNTYFEVEDIDRGVRGFVRRESYRTPTPVPSEDSQERALALAKCVFLGLTDLLSGKKEFPYKLTVPAYLQEPGNAIWVFPAVQWCKTAGSYTTYKTNRRVLQQRRRIAYDFDNGRLFTREELADQFPSTADKWVAFLALKIAKQTLADANSDFYHFRRVDRGGTAVAAFTLLFIANTGMNFGQVRSLPWSNEFPESITHPETERVGFRAIKYRAGNKHVSFEVGLKFLPLLKQYLKLRTFLLNGRESDYLFIGGKGFLGKISGFHNYFNSILRIDESHPRVFPREWRASKQDYVIRITDPHTAARIMQHSLSTAIKKYTNGTETDQVSEMGAFWNCVENIVVAKGVKVKNGENLALGLCSYPEHPNPISTNAPIEPDCKAPEGCLFCDKYRVHADKVDTRKLLSCRYCIQKTSHLSSSDEQFERVFGITLRRIEFLTNEIRKYDPNLVEVIEKEIDVDGELDPYWALKLETLMELDLV